MEAVTLKILRLAFNPAAHESEAIAAFLKSRTYHKQILASLEAETPSILVVMAPTATMHITIDARNYDILMTSIHTYKSTPFCTVTPTASRARIIDPYHLEIKAYLPIPEAQRFSTYLKQVVDIINESNRNPDPQPVKKTRRLFGFA